MTLFSLNIRRLLLFYGFICVLFFASCVTGKKTTPPPPVAISVPDSIEIYNCNFEKGSFSGTLPCFGNECGDYGAPLTTLQFMLKSRLTKKLEKENGAMEMMEGKWLIREDCIIEINYQDSTMEYYRFHEGINKIERLTSNQESFPGNLNKHNYLSKTR